MQRKLPASWRDNDEYLQVWGSQLPLRNFSKIYSNRQAEKEWCCQIFERVGIYWLFSREPNQGGCRAQVCVSFNAGESGRRQNHLRLLQRILGSVYHEQPCNSKHLHKVIQTILVNMCVCLALTTWKRSSISSQTILIADMTYLSNRQRKPINLNIFSYSNCKRISCSSKSRHIRTQSRNFHMRIRSYRRI